MLRIGTCSWKYDSWGNLVYKDPFESNLLKQYSGIFNTVEIDQWFWSLFGKDKVLFPNPETVIEYNNSVPDSFKFTIKLPNSITLTHFYSKSKQGGITPNPHFLSLNFVEHFLQIIEPMKKKIGILMFQFEYLNKQKITSYKEFIKMLSLFFSKLPEGYQYGIEIRNPNFIKSDYFIILNEFGISPVFIQGYYMPNLWEIIPEYINYIEKSMVLRLMGPDRKAIERETSEKWNKIVFPKDDEIKKICEVIFPLIEKEVDIYINVNNHYEGSAPITIEKLNNLLHK